MPRRAFEIAKGHHEHPEKAGMGPNHPKWERTFLHEFIHGPPPYPKYVNKDDHGANITLNT